jgi:peptidoglycan/xylan/chitin deacetylase (PgdA/CDA1 family)
MIHPCRKEKIIQRVLAILSFHKIGDPGPGGWNSWFYIPEKTFAGHLRFLKDNDWNVIDVPAFLAGLRAFEKLPERAVLLTFDDGYRSVREVALPWLRRFGYPAVSFVSTGYIGGCSNFDSGVEPEEPICDWKDLRELQRQGISIQSHGVTHRGFSSLGPEEQEEELTRSKVVLEAQLGNRVEVFAFPYGDNGGNPPECAKTLEKVGFRAACVYGGGPNPLPVADTYRLTRVAMGPDTDLEKELDQK